MKAALRAWVAHLSRCDQCGQYARDYIRGCVRGPRCPTGQTLRDELGRMWEGRNDAARSRGPKWHRSVGHPKGRPEMVRWERSRIAGRTPPTSNASDVSGGCPLTHLPSAITGLDLPDQSQTNP